MQNNNTKCLTGNNWCHFIVWWLLNRRRLYKNPNVTSMRHNHNKLIKCRKKLSLFVSHKQLRAVHSVCLHCCTDYRVSLIVAATSYRGQLQNLEPTKNCFVCAQNGYILTFRVLQFHVLQIHVLHFHALQFWRFCHFHVRHFQRPLVAYSVSRKNESTFWALPSFELQEHFFSDSLYLHNYVEEA